MAQTPPSEKPLALQKRIVDLTKRIKNSLTQKKIVKSGDFVYDVVKKIVGDGKFLYLDPQLDIRRENETLDNSIKSYPEKRDTMYKAALSHLIVSRIDDVIERKYKSIAIDNDWTGKCAESIAKVLLPIIKQHALLATNKKSAQENLLQEKERNMLVKYAVAVVVLGAFLASLPRILKKEAVDKFLNEKAPEKVFNLIKSISRNRAVSFTIGGIATMALALVHVAHSSEQYKTAPSLEGLKISDNADIKGALKELLKAEYRDTDEGKQAIDAMINTFAATIEQAVNSRI